MRFGHRLRGKVTGYDERGRGVFVAEERKIAVPFTAIGDDIEATFVRRDRGIKIAKLESIISPSPNRVTAPCPHAGVCGGCLWQHLAYPAQLDIKLGMINAAFERAGHEERVERIEPATEQFHHRNRMDYVVGWNGTVGLKEYDSWGRYVDLSTCLLLNEGAHEILRNIREWIRENDLTPWDAKHHVGDIRYAVVREGKRTGERLITIVVHSLERISESARADLTARLSPLCTSLLLGEQSAITDLSLAQKFETLRGNPWLEDIASGIRYRIHPNSFFQTNTAMAEKLQEEVRSDLPVSANSILDLYCGLGFFGIYLAKELAALRIHGVEIDAEAIELAKHNANVNGVADRCTFTVAKAEDMSWKDIPADAVILDPPRAGLHPKVLRTILEKAPRTIVYVSCNYKHLVDELVEFKKKYRIERLSAFDLFPHTPHVEVVCNLALKSNE